MAETTLRLEILEEAGEWSGLDPERLLGPVPAAVAEREPAEGLVTVVLADDAKVKDLNSRFRGKDKATNVLSFPAGDIGVPDEDHHLGDVVLARETLEREAGEQGKNPHHHFIHLVVHGILHVLGHDHIDEEEAERMESLEVAILGDLGLPDPYAETQTSLTAS